MKPLPILRATLLLLTVPAAFAAPAEPKFDAVTIDPAVQIGYGVDIADVDGDRKPDILLADKKQFVWYRNPGANWQDARQWKKHVLAENLTQHDNVCLAAQDLDGDGKCEIAVGAEWNPGDTVNSGAVFYLVPPSDRTQKWEAVKLHAEPTVHRMRWIPLAGSAAKFGLVVAPLHGRGNKNAEGEPVKILLYTPPAGDPKGEWTTEPISASLHATHNFQPLDWNGKSGIVLGGKEALLIAAPEAGKWRETGLANTGTKGFAGVGEVRVGKVGRDQFFATVEPMHGNMLAIYRMGHGDWERVQITDKMADGHALACGDLLRAGSDQIVIGWRGNPKNAKNIGVEMWIAQDERGSAWKNVTIDPDGMACEDLRLADMDGDGKLDIAAAGRATKNLKVYFNRAGR